MTDDLGTQILASVNQMRSDLTAHMREEGKEIKEIHDKLEDWRIAAERRHDSLVTSLGAFMERADTTSAFPEDKKGKPDLDGHRGHHESLIEADKLAKERSEKIKTAWMEKGGWGAILIIALAVWEYIKRQVQS